MGKSTLLYCILLSTSITYAVRSDRVPLINPRIDNGVADIACKRYDPQDILDEIEQLIHNDQPDCKQLTNLCTSEPLLWQHAFKCAYIKYTTSLGKMSEALQNLFEHLLMNGVNINTQDGQGNTLLMSAARFHDASFIEWLLHKGANKSIQDNDGNTALAWAVDTWNITKPSLDAIKLLYDSKLLFVKNNQYLSPLALAQKNPERTKIVEYFILGSEGNV